MPDAPPLQRWLNTQQAQVSVRTTERMEGAEKTWAAVAYGETLLSLGPPGRLVWASSVARSATK